MLMAAERWGGGAGERPFLPRAFSVLRAGAAADGLELAVPARGRRARAPNRLCELGPRRRAVARRAARPRLRRRPATDAARCWSAAGSGSPRWPSGRTSSAPGTPALLGFRDAEHAAGAALLQRRARWPPTTAAPATTAWSPSCSTTSSTTTATPRSTPAGRRRCSRRCALLCADARDPRPARARVRDGVRLRRLLRVRGADRARLRPAVPGGSRARRRRARARDVRPTRGWAIERAARSRVYALRARARAPDHQRLGHV